jgi:hypothetical protein
MFNLTLDKTNCSVQSYQVCNREVCRSTCHYVGRVGHPDALAGRVHGVDVVVACAQVGDNLAVRSKLVNKLRVRNFDRLFDSKIPLCLHVNAQLLD